MCYLKAISVDFSVVTSMKQLKKFLVAMVTIQIKHTDQLGTIWNYHSQEYWITGA